MNGHCDLGESPRAQEDTPFPYFPCNAYSFSLPATVQYVSQGESELSPGRFISTAHREKGSLLSVLCRLSGVGDPQDKDSRLLRLRPKNV